MAATAASCGRWRSLRRSADLEVRAPLSLLCPELLPVFQALQDLALEAAFDRLVELLARHAVGEVVLAREAVLGIVVVLVALGIAEVLHEPGGRVQDVHGRRQRAVLLGRAL